MPPTKKDSNDMTVEGIPASKMMVPGQNYTELYVNSSQGAFSPWDIEVTFGRLGVIDGAPRIEALTKLIFSPSHAKALTKVLESAVRGYEEKFGEINLTEEQLPRLPKATPVPRPK